MIELNKIYNEDCLEGMKRIPDGSVDCIVTSPPYDNQRKYGGVELFNFDKFKDIAYELFRILAEGGVCVWIVGDATINGSETGTSFRQVLHFMECGFLLHDTTSVRDKPFVKCKFHRPCIVTQESARSYDMGGCMMKAFPC